MNLFEQSEQSGAEFSPCRKYRYALWRIWNPAAPLAMFIGLNPSTANEDGDDRTIQRVTGIVQGWGYGGFYMMNLFAIVSKDPDVLKTHADPLGDNDGWIEKIAPKCSMIVFAWGNFKEARERCKFIIEMFPDAYALYINQNGSPKHPLFCPKKTTPVKFKQ
jgi:hypothetical protein